MRTLRYPAAAALLLFAISPLAAEDPGHRFTVPLGDPTRPALLIVSLTDGRLSVRAYDGDAVVVVAHEPPRGQREDDDDDADSADARRAGLKRIPGTSIGVTAEARDNTVTVGADWSGRGVDLEILVPQRTSVRAAAINGGDLRVQGVAGEHELSNVNGSVIAEDIAGSAVINSTNGDLKVSFTEVADNKPMSFTTFNGDLDVAFPDGLAADWRISAGHGEVLTDFDIELEPQEPTVETSGGGDRYRVRLEQDTRATVGGGGPEMRFKTVNGDVIIRRR